jgi:hypothetical protein
MGVAQLNISLQLTVLTMMGAKRMPMLSPP